MARVPVPAALVRYLDSVSRPPTSQARAPVPGSVPRKRRPPLLWLIAAFAALTFFLGTLGLALRLRGDPRTHVPGLPRGRSAVGTPDSTTAASPTAPP